VLVATAWLPGVGARTRKCNQFPSGKAGNVMSIDWQNFDLSNEFNILRIICALFFIPHIVAKFTVPAALKFYVDVGFKPPAFWMYLAGSIETVLTIGLFFNIYTQFVGIIAFIHLIVAAIATYKLTKSWIWVIGGIEFCVFWAICCLAVALHAYHGM
jgi:putative oxidoreductase